MLEAEESPKVEHRIKSDAVKRLNGGGVSFHFPPNFPVLLSLNRKEKISCPGFFNFEDFFLNRPYRRHKKGD